MAPNIPHPGPLSFDFHPRTRVVCGVGAVERVGEIVSALPAGRVLLVTDPGLVAAGHADRVRQLIEAAGSDVTLFDRVRENPTTRCVDDCAEIARAAGIEGFVALGGGSAMDTAKGANFLLTNGGRMQDYWGVGKAAKPMLPLVAIPTTAGTGSELQCAALIADETTHQKMACLDPKAAARVAILDAALTVSQPDRVTACTGVDAIAHAVETAVTTKGNAVSWLFARESFRLSAAAFPQVLRDPRNLEARARMLLAAAWAGAAIEQSMLGAAHAAANPLTAHFDIVHGQAVGVMLPHVVRFNASDPKAAEQYAELAAIAGLGTPGDAALKLADWLAEILGRAGLAVWLSQLNVPKSALPTLAGEAARQWTAQFNPRPVTAADFAALYALAWPA